MGLKMTTIRMEEGLLAWSEVYASTNHTTRSELIRDLLEALREDRLRVRPRAGPNAFPAEEQELGASPDFPALVCSIPTTHQE